MQRILIVEDEVAYITLLHDTLAENYEILDAHDGKEGLRKALKEHPDLILLDIKMPLMDGLSMLEELRKDPYGKQVKVILLTNLEPDDTVIGQVIKGEPTYYWVKSDIKLYDVVKKVKKLLAA